MNQEGYGSFASFHVDDDPESRTVSMLCSIGPDFWKHLPADPEAFARKVKQFFGISITFWLDYALGACVKNKYGNISVSKLMLSYQEWQRDRIKFIKKQQPKLTIAMKLFEADYRAGLKKLEENYRQKVAGLPTPPPGYYWKRDDRLLAVDKIGKHFRERHTVNLWNDAFGPAPWEGQGVVF